MKGITNFSRWVACDEKSWNDCPTEQRADRLVKPALACIAANLHADPESQITITSTRIFGPFGWNAVDCYKPGWYRVVEVYQ